MSLELRHIGKRYGGERALDDVSLALVPGRVLGLVGPNGAGKTTLLRIAAGLVRPSEGSVVFATPAHGAASRYFGGEQTLPPQVSARDWLRLWQDGPHTCTPARRIGVLSRGTRQRVGLEATLASGGACLLLDEPWEGLDPDASRWLSETLAARRQAGGAAMVSSHRIHDLAAVCDECMFLVRGRLARESVVTGAEQSHADRVAQLLDAFDRAKGSI